MPGELSRIAVEVDDIEAAVADLRAVLGIEIADPIDIAEMGIRAAVSASGIELVQRTEPDPLPAKHWRPPLAAAIIAVDSLDAAAERMKAAGVPLIQTVITPTGFREAFYGAGFHGLPLVLCQRDEVHLLHSDEINGEMEVDWSPTGVPPARTTATTE
jgi:hypothetical protein